MKVSTISFGLRYSPGLGVCVLSPVKEEESHPGKMLPFLEVLS